MSINTSNANSLNIDVLLDKAVSQVIRYNNKPYALDLIQSCGLSDEQTARIKTALVEFNPDPIIRTSHELELALKNRIIAVLKNGDQITQILPQNKIGHLCVSETTSCEFANAYPCKIEYEGKGYRSATACFLAQQYTDQPHIMDLFTYQPQILDLFAQCETAQEALLLASQYTVTPERKQSWNNSSGEEHVNIAEETSFFWRVMGSFHCDPCPMAPPFELSHENSPNKDEVMMRVLRAKFEQNPELKEKLLASNDVYFVWQGNDPYWSSGLDGTQQNELGKSLMRLREEFGGCGIVPPSMSYNNIVLDWKDRCHSLSFKLDEVITYEIFKQCLFGNVKGILALSFTNKHFYKQITAFVNGTDLMQLCPKLTILDAKTLGFTINDEPCIPKFSLAKCYHDLADLVENDDGVTLLTMPEDIYFGEIVRTANQAGITFSSSKHELIKEVAGYDTTCCTKRVLITNNVLLNSRNKNYYEQRRLLGRIRCGMPGLSEYAALCVFQKIFNNKDLYVQGTYGRSSTHSPTNDLIDDYGDLMTVGDFALDNLAVNRPCSDRPSPHIGVGGKRVFRSEPCTHSENCTIS